RAGDEMIDVALLDLSVLTEVHVHGGHHHAVVQRDRPDGAGGEKARIGLVRDCHARTVCPAPCGRRHGPDERDADLRTESSSGLPGRAGRRSPGCSRLGVMSGRMILSVSGIRDVTRDLVDAFARETDARGVPLSLFVAPRLKDHYRLARDPATQEWLLERREGGDAIVLHGYDQAATKRRRAEFATLPEHEARLRLLAADRVLEETGLRTRLFAPPRWRASPGAVAALPQVGFRMMADHAGI